MKLALRVLFLFVSMAHAAENKGFVVDGIVYVSITSHVLSLSSAAVVLKEMPSALLMRDGMFIRQDLVKDSAAKVQSPPLVRAENLATIVAAGDIIFSPRLLELYPGDSLKRIFDGIRPLVSSADFAFANLEGCVSERGKQRDKEFTFRAPPAVVQIISAAGFDGVNLANNHAGDYGKDALLDTIAYAKKAGLVALGAGKDNDDAWRSVFVSAGDLSVALNGFCDTPPGCFGAGWMRPGVAMLTDSWRKRVKALSQGHKDTVGIRVATVHWGVEKEFEPTDQQTEKGKFLLNSGFDAVIAHHPHRVQGIEVVGGKVIAYSLGNFAHTKGGDWADRTFLLSLRASSRGLVDGRVIPVKINSGMPQIASGQEAETILKRVRELSRKLGTAIDESGHFWIAQPYRVN